MMFFWLVIISVLLYYLVRGNINFDLFEKKGSANILDERLAKGEISIEEYKEIKSTMKGENR